ncbi:Hypothetical Protein PANA_3227 [Pantoea ananatis LMG 20103]|uniref:Uncharacterized protein n=1 Tax=Pantoea ananatis (strain LMG 20103) TaxID=706191 RepID=D4GMC6_PANAM|nr:Hypothetical Protein PANA_3227 [Pantoea ananatis LMG 20103]
MFFFKWVTGLFIEVVANFLLNFLQVDNVIDNDDFFRWQVSAVGDVFCHHEHIRYVWRDRTEIGVFNVCRHIHRFKHFFDVHFHHEAASQA